MEAKSIIKDGHVRNVKQCFSLNNSARVGSGIRLAPGYANTLSSHAIDPYNGAPRMKTDVEYQIRFVLGSAAYGYLLITRC